MILKDTAFVRSLEPFCRRGRAHALPDRSIEIVDYGTKAGLEILISDSEGLLIGLAWSPKGASVVDCYTLDPTLADDSPEALTALVRRFLLAHELIDERGVTTRKGAAFDWLILGIGALGEAIASGDWTYARKQWEWLAPFHPMLFENDPSLVHTATVLRNNELFASPCNGTVN